MVSTSIALQLVLGLVKHGLKLRPHLPLFICMPLAPSPLSLSLSALVTWQIAWLGAITTNSWREIILAKASLGHGREQQMKLFSYFK